MITSVGLVHENVKMYCYSIAIAIICKEKWTHCFKEYALIVGILKIQSDILCINMYSTFGADKSKVKIKNNANKNMVRKHFSEISLQIIPRPSKRLMLIKKEKMIPHHISYSK